MNDLFELHPADIQHNIVNLLIPKVRYDMGTELFIVNPPWQFAEQRHFHTAINRKINIIIKRYYLKRILSIQ